MVFSTTLNNISVILCRSGLLVEYPENAPICRKSLTKLDSVYITFLQSLKPLTNFKLIRELTSVYITLLQALNDNVFFL